MGSFFFLFTEYENTEFDKIETDRFVGSMDQRNYNDTMTTTTNPLLMMAQHSFEAKNDDQTARFTRLKRRYKIHKNSLIMILVGAFNLLSIAILMWYRRFYKKDAFHTPVYDSLRSIAKNTAIMTIVNLFLLLITRAHHVKFVLWFVIFSVIHSAMHFMLGMNYKLHYLEYFRDHMIHTISGMMLLVNILFICCSNCCKNFTIFYTIHIINTILLLIFAATHSFFFPIAFAYPLMSLFFLRILRRLCLRPIFKPILVGNTFILFELIIKNTFVNRTLALNYLSSHNGNAVGWLSCKGLNSVFERHPFTILKSYASSESADTQHLQIAMSKFGDWKSQVYDIVKKNCHLTVYSCGLTCYLDSFTNDDNLNIFKHNSHILFVLENLDIARFLAFITMIKDPKNEKFRTFVRHIELHFKFDDYFLHQILLDYCSNLLTNSYSSSILLNIVLYYVPDANTPIIPNPMIGSFVQYITSKRINYNNVVRNFVNFYARCRLENNRASLKIVSTHEEKTDTAIKFITKPQNTIVEI